MQDQRTVVRENKRLHAALEHPLLLFLPNQSHHRFSYIMQSTAKQKQSRRSAQERRNHPEVDVAVKVKRKKKTVVRDFWRL
jgi:hypothetical protein